MVRHVFTVDDCESIAEGRGYDFAADLGTDTGVEVYVKLPEIFDIAAPDRDKHHEAA